MEYAALVLVREKESLLRELLEIRQCAADPQETIDRRVAILSQLIELDDAINFLLQPQEYKS